MPMDFDESLLRYLQSKSSVTNIVGQKIYFVQAPVNATAPYLVIQSISNPREQAFVTDPGVVHGRRQFTAIHTTYPGAKSILKALNTTSVFKDITGPMGTSGAQVDCTNYENEGDLIIDASLNYSGIWADWIFDYHE